MPTQTRVWQSKILAAARRDCYAGLYWYIETRIGLDCYASAAYPGKFVPVIPVGPDPEESRHWAHLLAELFKASNSAALEFVPALTSLEALEAVGVPWYEWGQPVTVDAICRGCGAVERVDCALLAHSPAWLCEVCGKGVDCASTTNE